MYFSQSTGGFYDHAIHGDNIPADAVAITVEEHTALMAGQSTGKRIVFGEDGRPILAEPSPPSLADILASIDAAADSARSAVAGDPLRAVEYEKSAAEAQAFKDSGYPVEAVPRTVAAWAIEGRTAQQAADSILAEAAAYNEALYQIRETRLQAKALVRAAMDAGQIEQAQDIAAETIAAIELAISGIGNAGA